MNSRDKGARGEREWSRWLSARGFDARRGQQFSGSPDSPDVVCKQLAGFHAEVKRTERLRLVDAIEQAKADSGEAVPYVATRRNRGEWLVVMRAEDWINLVREVAP